MLQTYSYTVAYMGCFPNLPIHSSLYGQCSQPTCTQQLRKECFPIFPIAPEIGTAQYLYTHTQTNQTYVVPDISRVSDQIIHSKFPNPGRNLKVNVCHI